MMRQCAVLMLSGLFLATALVGCGSRDPGKPVVRMGFFPNVTHAQGVVAQGLARRAGGVGGKGWYEERVPGVEIQWYSFNAGPTAMEAILTDALDLSYVGPNPALNAYTRSKGEDIRVIRGSAVGGSALVVQGDDRIRAAADFRGKRVATPQFGNTQDIACRIWLGKQGFRVTKTGGDVDVVPTANPDQLTLFKKGDLDAVWTVEPWVSRLVLDGGGKVFLEEPEAVTTILVASARFLREHRDLARAIGRAHGELTEWIVKNPVEARAVFAEEFERITRSPISPKLLEMAWNRLTFTAKVDPKALEAAVNGAREVGFVEETVDLSRLVEEP